MQRQLQSLDLGCSFLFKLCFCSILFMDGMTNGLDMMNSFGETFILCFRLQVFLIKRNILVTIYFHSLRCPGFFRYIALLVVSLVCYVATFASSTLLFYLFTPSGHDCGLNTFFIVMTLIFVFVFTIATLHPSVSFCTFLFYRSIEYTPL